MATQIPKVNPDEFSRCEQSAPGAGHGRILSPGQAADAALKGAIEHALWKDDILRATEFYEIDTQVKNGIVYLYGHIVNTNSKSRIENAMRSIPAMLGIQNHLVLDDRLTLDVAGSLAELEHTYSCKFFTGASHGVISLNGNVNDENVKLLAEQRAARNPNVRGVINNVRVAGAEQEFQGQRFLQPALGEMIYFLDGVFGVVVRVIINPSNRLVIAMVIEEDPSHSPKGLADGYTPPLQRLVVVPMTEVRYLTKVSGFLSIRSNERNRYTEFNPTHFFAPKKGWKAPHPYCPDDVLFPIEQLDVWNVEQLPGPPLVIALQEQALWEQLLADENLGG